MDHRDFELVTKVADRTLALLPGGPSKLDLLITLDACHTGPCPLDLERLAEAPNFDLLHDVLGIYRHLDRTTRELGGCFIPRFARKEGR